MTAICYSYLGSSGQMLPNEAFAIVHRYADEARVLDDTIAESHIAKTNAYLFYEWKWNEAYDALQTAIRLNPGAVEAYELLGFYYNVMGEIKKAVQTLEEAEKLDPLSPVVLHALGNMYVFDERYDDAIAQADKLLKTDPNMRASIEMKG